MRSIPPGEEFEIQVTFPHGIVAAEKPAWQKGESNIVHYVAAGLFGFIFIIYTALWWAYDIKRLRKYWVVRNIGGPISRFMGRHWRG